MRWPRSAATIDPDARVAGLTRTEKSLVAIARALAVEAEIIVLDEPTASLPADEVARLVAVLRGLRGRNVGMIYVSHRLDEVFEVADEVAVLRDGRLVGRKPVAETTPRELVTMIVGRPPEQVFVRAQTSGKAVGAGAARPADRRRRTGLPDVACGRDAGPGRSAWRRAGAGRPRAVRARRDRWR